MYVHIEARSDNNLNHDYKKLRVILFYILRKDFNLTLKSLKVPASITCSGRLFHSWTKNEYLQGLHLALFQHII